MLHRNYFLLFLAAMMMFFPQVTLADETVNQSVYDQFNNEQVNENPAQPERNSDTAGEGEDEDSLTVNAFDFIKMFIALAFVLFLIYFLLKFVTKRNRIFQQGQSIVNIGGTGVGQNKSIQIVKVGNRILVIGVGESISLLTEIHDEQERRELIEEFERKQEQVVEPRDLLQRLSTIVRNIQKHQSDNGDTFSSSFKEHLEKLKTERTKQLEDVKRKGLNKHE